MACEAPRYLRGVINPPCAASDSLFIRVLPLLDNETRLFTDPLRSLGGGGGAGIFRRSCSRARCARSSLGVVRRSTNSPMNVSCLQKRAANFIMIK